MKAELRQAIEETIGSATGTTASIVETRSCSGGCIHIAQLVVLNDPREFFVKSGTNVSRMYEQEASGLLAIDAANALRVPKVIGQVSVNGTDALVLEAIQEGSKPKGFFEQFGKNLARLHRESTSRGFGWETANWIGATPQANTWRDGWAEFFVSERIEPQLKLAKSKGLAQPPLISLWNKLVHRIPGLLAGSGEPPALLHGDLWNGNFMCDSSGEPVVFDPATYYGHREMEFAMTQLFGGFPQSFYEAYDREWPLLDGWQDRVELYKLYHLLNHLNLFGSGYYSGCLKIMQRFA